MDNTKKLNHLSLCTGYGGIDLGLKKAVGNVRTVAYVEIETFPICNLVAKMENGLIDAAPIWSNLKTFPWELFSRKVDILSGGFPCQPFSAAGRRKGDEDPRHLWPYITKGIQQLGKPSIIFLENVEGIISSKLKGDHWSDPEGTPILLHVLRELERLGYKATAGLFSAREVGAPHRRKRVFILGIKRGTEREGLEWVNELLERNRDTSGSSVYPASRGREQHLWEPPRVTVGDSQYVRPPRPEEQRGTEETSESRGKEETLPSWQSTGTGEPSRSQDLSRSSERESRNADQSTYISVGHTNHAGNIAQAHSSDKVGKKAKSRWEERPQSKSSRSSSSTKLGNTLSKGSERRWVVKRE
ncbi:MAG: DNA cytosine methyltransferase, partial [bacterium]